MKFNQTDPRARESILAIDLGDRHVGFAVYQPSHGVGSLMPFSYRDLYELQQRIVDNIREYSISLLVVGDMGRGELPKASERIFAKIEAECNVQHVLFTERLSTYQVHQSGGNAMGDLEHSQAAVEILRDFLAQS